MARAQIIASVSHDAFSYVGQVVELQDYTGRKFLARITGAPSSTVLNLETLGHWSSRWWRMRHAIARPWRAIARRWRRR